MMIHGRILHEGKYVIMVAPEFNKIALTNNKYQIIRTGIYSPVNIKMEKCKNNTGYSLLANVFTNIAKGR